MNSSAEGPIPDLGNGTRNQQSASVFARPKNELDPLLKDSFGRRFSYLRLSITDVCNFSCTYCLPNGYDAPKNRISFLSLNEIKNLAKVFAKVGTRKIRLTGGEPTLRSDLLEIAQAIKEIPEIEQLSLSTNGFRLKSLAPRLKHAGFNSINVSLDTLDTEKFFQLTKSRRLPEILDGIEAALDAGFPLIKVNAVLMKRWNADELDRFLEWVKVRPVVVRFIELMQTGTNQILFKENHVSGEIVRRKLISGGWYAKSRGVIDGPAQEYTHPDYIGRMGIIAPYAKDFCADCNRLRVTSVGDLRLCLFGEGGHPLRDLLQSPEQTDELVERLHQILKHKEISHFLPEGKYGNNTSFSAMGG